MKSLYEFHVFMSHGSGIRDCVSLRKSESSPKPKRLKGTVTLSHMTVEEVVCTNHLENLSAVRSWEIERRSLGLMALHHEIQIVSVTSVTQTCSILQFEGKLNLC